MGMEGRGTSIKVVMFTDIVGSVDMKKRIGAEAYAPLIEQHDVLFRQAVETIDGADVRQDTGDGFLALFETPSDAVRAALRFQYLIRNQTWGYEQVMVRVGLNMGEVTLVSGGDGGQGKMMGMAIDLGSRIAGLAEPGQILMTRGVYENAQQYIKEHPQLDSETPPPRLRWESHGAYKIRGVEEPVEVFEVGAEGIGPFHAPEGGEKAVRKPVEDEGKYGAFEKVGTVSLRGAWRLYTAKKTGESEVIYAIEAFAPHQQMMDETKAQKEIKVFEERVQIQRRMSDGGNLKEASRYWAPIFQQGRKGQESFYVTRLYGESIQKLITRKLNLNHKNLRGVAESVVRGLMDMETRVQRGHGGLEISGRILIKSLAELARPGGVVLTDPVIGSDLGADGGRAADQRALGRLIYQMVNHQLLGEASLQEVHLTAAWRHLGPGANRWVDFVNLLLKAAESGQALPLRDVLKKLPREKKFGMVTVAGVVLALAAGGGAYWWLNQDGDSGETKLVATEGVDIKDAWAGLCNAYFNGFGKFVEGLGSKSAGAGAARSALESDPWMKEKILGLLDKAEKQKVELDPKKIDRSNLAYDRMKFNPPSDGQAASRAQLAWSVVRQVQEALRDWPLLEEMGTSQKKFAELQWNQTAGELGRRVEAVSPASPKVEEIVAALQTRNRIQSAWLKWEGLLKLSEALKGTGDPTLIQFREYMVGQVAEPAGSPAAAGQALEALDRRMDQMEQLGAEMRGVMGQAGWGKVQWKLLPPGPALMQMNRQAWVARANLGLDYAALEPSEMPYASQAAAWWTALGETEKVMAAKTYVAKASGRALPMSDPLGGLEEWLSAMQAELDGKIKTAPEALVKRIRHETAQIPDARQTLGNLRKLEPVKKNLPRMNELSRQLGTSLKELSETVRRPAEDPAEWIARMRARADVSLVSAAINKSWAAGRDAMLAGANVEQLKVDFKKFDDLKARVEMVEEVLRKLDKLMDRGQAGAGREREWNKALAAEMDAIREVRIIQALQAGDPANYADKPATALDGAWMPVITMYQADRKGLDERIGLLNEIQDMLEAGYDHAESPGAGGRSLQALEALLAGAPKFEAGIEGRMGQAVAPLMKELADLKAVASINQPAELAGIVEKDDLKRVSRIRSAWKKLGTLGWPASLADLQAEEKLRARMELMSRQLAEVRAKAVRAELTSEGAARWLACYVKLKDEADIRTALQMRARFEVADGVMPVEARFNLALEDLRNAAAGWKSGMAKDEQVSAGLEMFITRFKELKIPQGDDVAKNLETIGRGPAPQGPDPKLVGPASELVADGLRWAGGGEAGADLVSYKWMPPGGRAELKLDFKLVKGTGTTPVYMGMSEVSVELFVDVLKAAGPRGFDEIEKLLDMKRDSDDGRRGPVSWRWNRQGSMQWFGKWLYRNPSQVQTDQKLYFDGYAGGVSPTGAMPLQYVSPQAAVYFSRLLGCRLPSSAEWKAALEQEGRNPVSANLRDKTWASQHARIKQLRDELGEINDRPEFPDTDIFPRVALPMGDPPRGPAALAAVEEDDGKLWFDEVMPAADAPSLKVRHLVGNVAEFVFDEPAKMLEDLKDPKALSAADVDKFMEGAGKGLAGVIGGSALSAREIKVDQVNPLQEMAAARKGYSDVGFRLAFAAGPGSRLDRLFSVVLKTGKFLVR